MMKIKTKPKVVIGSDCLPHGGLMSDGIKTKNDTIMYSDILNAAAKVHGDDDLVCMLLHQLAYGHTSEEERREFVTQVKLRRLMPGGEFVIKETDNMWSVMVMGDAQSLPHIENLHHYYLNQSDALDAVIELNEDYGYPITVKAS